MARRLSISFVLLTTFPLHAAERILYTPDELRHELANRLSPDELASLEIPFEADAALRAAAETITRSASGDGQKLSSLLHHFKENQYLDRYNAAGTYSATEVFARKEGNCLSYANLFVAMARSVGLQAFFLDASAVQHEFGKTGSVLVDYGHILAGVQVNGDRIAVDFDGRPKQFLRTEILTDLQAIAEFYSNRGYELSWKLRAAGGFAAPQALAAFRLATRIAPGFARGWNNLGVALGRAGRFDEAADAYRLAIRAQDDLPAPHANLGQLLLRHGDLEGAVAELRSAVSLASGNAHYRYFLGKALALHRDYQAALEQLQIGAQLDQDMFQIHMTLASVYLALEDYEKAMAAVKRVLAIIPGHRDANRLLRCLAQGGEKTSCG